MSNNSSENSPTVRRTSGFMEYQKFYIQRVQNLERFKEKVCSSEGASSSSQKLDTPVASQPKPEDLENKFEKLRENMVALMEKDVTLMRQLLALNETVEDLKAWNTLSSASSATSLLEEEADLDPRNGANGDPAANLVKNDDSGDFPTLPEQSTQYFSRKNSVLRIPIPPNHGRNRIKTIASAGSWEDGDDNSSGISSNSRGSSGTNYSRPSSFGNKTVAVGFGGKKTETSLDGNDNLSGISSNSRELSGTNYSWPSSFGNKTVGVGFGGKKTDTSLNEEFDDDDDGDRRDDLPPLASRKTKNGKDIARHESQASCDSGINLASGENDKEEVFV